MRNSEFADLPEKIKRRILFGRERSLRNWWRTDRPIFWNHGDWDWGWLGNGWNCLRLGKIRIYFKRTPFPRLRKWFGRKES